MNAGMAHSHESHFGPPSEPIDISAFRDSALAVESVGAFSAPVYGAEAWDDLSETQRKAIEAECNVSDLQSSITDVWNNPILVAHVLKGHEATVGVIHESADKSNKRKRKRAGIIDSSQEPPEATALQEKLDSIQLKSWPLHMHSALFMRTPKNTDQNVLTEVKQMASDSSSVISPTLREVVITLTVHNRLTWGRGYFFRSSQHAILASQTLGDLFDVIPCTSNERPEEIVEDGQVVGYERNGKPAASSGCVLCIEGIAYGDGLSEIDYADNLIRHFTTFPADKRPLLQKAPTTMHDTPFSSLTLRVNEPYWLLHQGNCEHFIVVDQIRLQHPADLTSRFPLTLQITPPLLDICRICSKVPAILSVVGDMRLGESPCVLCDPCWRSMGQPDPKEEVIVVPLPRHEHGW